MPLRAHWLSCTLKGTLLSLSISTEDYPTFTLPFFSPVLLSTFSGSFHFRIVHARQIILLAMLIVPDSDLIRYQKSDAITHSATDSDCGVEGCADAGVRVQKLFQLTKKNESFQRPQPRWSAISKGITKLSCFRTTFEKRLTVFQAKKAKGSSSGHFENYRQKPARVHIISNSRNKASRRLQGGYSSYGASPYGSGGGEYGSRKDDEEDYKEERTKQVRRRNLME